MFSFEIWFAQQHKTIPFASAKTVLALSEGGATIPFIARYRKDQTGNLDEVGVQHVLEAKERWDAIESRKKTILDEIGKQGKLTPELKTKLEDTYDLTTLEDLYLPYKQKRKTRATVAREAGLEPFAEWIWATGHSEVAGTPTLLERAAEFLNAEAGVTNVEKVLDGAKDIIVERLSEDVTLREGVRHGVFERGALTTKKGEKAKPNSKFENYFAHHESIKALSKPEASHRYLAMRRGWMEEELVASVGGAPEDATFDADLQAPFEHKACTNPNAPGADLLKKAARLAYRVYVFSGIETEVHKSLRDIADAAAIHVFAENLRKLLLAAPYGAKSVLGVDPGIRSGCKLALVSDTGAYLGSHLLHLATERERMHAKELLKTVLPTANVTAIAVGNGTAGRETETYFRTTLKELGMGSIPIVMVSEAGASVYSASEVARDEFPDLDLTIRGAISIARRFQDPLAELVKVDPKSIGVGQYQHDVSPLQLKKSLDAVVDSCVNSVGVNVNTASPYVLARVAGIGPSLARSITEHRQKKGIFRRKRDLLDVPRLSERAFEQAAGFLRIPGGENPLDNTGIHPERFAPLEALATRLSKNVADLIGPGAELVKKDAAIRSEVGEFTFKDIVAELERPGRDPRESFVAWSFREDLHELGDLQAGMMCPGIVTNVTNFGAFIDIGVHQDGLAHISELADRFVKDPRDVVSPGDRVTVRVLEVNLAKKQIALSMKSAGSESRPKPTASATQNQNRPRTAPAQAAQKPFVNDAMKKLEQFRSALKASAQS